MRSMTGYGQGAAENERWRVSVTLRGVNHRYLDLALRLREDQRSGEQALRELLGKRLWRGRVEVGLAVESLRPHAVTIEINEPAVERLSVVRKELAARGMVSDEPLRLAELLKLPDVVTLRADTEAWGEEDQELLFGAVDTALDGFLAAKETEGRHLAEILAARLAELTSVVEQLEVRRPEAVAEMHTQLAQRVQELAGEIVEPERLAQEVAILADRSDVSEELDRLTAHLKHFREVIAAEGKSIGKKLDFLAQEIHRELNTVGSKCRDNVMTRSVLDGKSYCEQLREQVQNVE